MVLSTGKIKDFSGVKSKGDELKFRLSSSNKIDSLREAIQIICAVFPLHSTSLTLLSLVYSVYWPRTVLYVDRLIIKKSKYRYWLSYGLKRILKKYQTITTKRDKTVWHFYSLCIILTGSENHLRDGSCWMLCRTLSINFMKWVKKLWVPHFFLLWCQTCFSGPCLGGGSSRWDWSN